MKKVVAILIFFMVSVGLSAPTDYEANFKAVEKYVQDNSLGKYYNLEPEKLSDLYLKQGGVLVPVLTTGKFKTALTVLDTFGIGNETPSSQVKLKLGQAGISVSDQEATVLADALMDSRTKVHVKMSAILADRYGLEFVDPAQAFQFFQDLVREEIQRPARPDSPSMQRIIGVLKRASYYKFKPPVPITAGEDFFDNLSVSLNHSITSFDDGTVGSSGNYRDSSWSHGGSMTEDWYVSVGLTYNRYETGSSNSMLARSLGMDLMFTYQMNDTVNLGLFGYYQQTDTEAVRQEAFGAGVGGVITTIHDLNYFNLLISNSVTWANYREGHDSLYVGSVTINKRWTDSFTTNFRAGYVDSLRTEMVGDNSYWTFGADLVFEFGQSSFTIGYERTEKLIDYRSNTLVLGYTYNF